MSEENLTDFYATKDYVNSSLNQVKTYLHSQIPEQKNVKKDIKNAMNQIDFLNKKLKERKIEEPIKKPIFPQPQIQFRNPFTAQQTLKILEKMEELEKAKLKKFQESKNS